MMGVQFDTRKPVSHESAELLVLMWLRFEEETFSSPAIEKYLVSSYIYSVLL